MPKILDGKVAIITGAGHGMGRAASRAFAAQGARLILADMNADTAEAAAAEICAGGGEAYAIKTDVTQEADVKKMVEFTVDRFNRLDCAFNNAGGVFGFGPVLELDQSHWESTYKLNFLGQLYCMKYEVEAMLKSGGGSIVNSSSNGSLRITPMGGAYAASKAGLNNLSMSVAVEYAAQNIRVNVISPGVIDTDSVGLKVAKDAGIDFVKDMRIPMGRTGRPEEIGECAAFLVSDLCGYMTGQIISVDGGLRARG